MIAAARKDQTLLPPAGQCQLDPISTGPAQRGTGGQLRRGRAQEQVPSLRRTARPLRGSSASPPTMTTRSPSFSPRQIAPPSVQGLGRTRPGRTSALPEDRAGILLREKRQGDRRHAAPCRTGGCARSPFVTPGPSGSCPEQVTARPAGGVIFSTTSSRPNWQAATRIVTSNERWGKCLIPRRRASPYEVRIFPGPQRSSLTCSLQEQTTPNAFRAALPEHACAGSTQLLRPPSADYIAAWPPAPVRGPRPRAAGRRAPSGAVSDPSAHGQADSGPSSRNGVRHGRIDERTSSPSKWRHNGSGRPGGMRLLVTGGPVTSAASSRPSSSRPGTRSPSSTTCAPARRARPARRGLRRGHAARGRAEVLSRRHRRGAALRGRLAGRRVGHGPGKYCRTTWRHARAAGGHARTGVRAIVFSSTAAAYGEPERTPDHRDRSRPPGQPLRRHQGRRRPTLTEFARLTASARSACATSTWRARTSADGAWLGERHTRRPT